jgi:hypothetical protein
MKIVCIFGRELTARPPILGPFSSLVKILFKFGKLLLFVTKKINNFGFSVASYRLVVDS